jgi:peroxiredoxin-like protein
MSIGPYYYETNVTWQGRRRGEAQVSGLPSITTSAPPEFDGEPGYWTPEHLFVAAVETCLMTTFFAVADKSKLNVISYRSVSIAKLDSVEGEGLRFTNLTVRPVIEVRRQEDRDKVARLLEKAERHCFVGNALRVRVQVEPCIEVPNGKLVPDARQVA